MNSVERVRELCAQRGIAISRLEKDCGFANGYIRGLREGKFPADRLRKIADYLEVSWDYLESGAEAEKISLSGKHYTFSDETAEMAQRLFENPDARSLFDAASCANSEDLQLVAEILRRMSRPVCQFSA